MTEVVLSEVDALKLAVRRSGSQYKLARTLEVSQTAIWKMLHHAKRASAEYVLKIESATGVSRHDLRPDLYPREDPPAQPPVPSPLGCPEDGTGGSSTPNRRSFAA